MKILCYSNITLSNVAVAAPYFKKNASALKTPRVVSVEGKPGQGAQKNSRSPPEMTKANI